MKLEQIERLPRFSLPLNLDRISTILSELDLLNPDFRWVHVAGTKGKGSTCVFLANILVEAKYKVGLFLSPHLCSPNERISLQLDPISQENIEKTSRILDEVLQRLSIHDISFFEYWTALALLIFRENHVDIAIIETGLGGRLDATNAIQNPLLSVITLIGRDHTDRLGFTVEEIAREKAGIIRQNTPVLSACQLPAVEEILKTTAIRHHSKYYSIYTDYDISFEKGNGFEPGKMNLISYLSGMAYTGLEISLIGKHQLQNASLALSATEILAKKGFCVDERIIREGLKKAFLPGRMERISYQNRTILLDGAHNPESFQALKEALSERFPERKFNVLFGSLKTKLYAENIQILSGIASKIWLTPIPGHDSVTSTEEFNTFGQIIFSLNSSKETVLSTFIQQSDPGDILIVTGSLYLVGWIRQQLIPGEKLRYKTSKEA
ncbi:bifunctional folylpolyglutamate synthase/dihydrofolate synthase [bacterium]|nr:bifunctional folylpolyglutamate synthase/dihydrofolate synthase [bacterium]